MEIDEEIIIYADGSSKDNPRRGGVGIRFIIPDYANATEIIHDEKQGSFIGATNNEMELYSCIVALEILLDNDVSKLRNITFCIDSAYVLKNLNNAKYNWPKKNWLSSSNVPIENVKHWEHLMRLLKKFNTHVNFEKVKAHQKGKLKDIHNDAVDRLSKEARESLLKIPFNVINARKKGSKHIAKKGCVEITGKQISIRILNCTAYKKHKDIFKCKYVVVSEDNPNYQMLDWVYYNFRLFEGHTYVVIMELRNKIPFIKENIDDITKNSRYNFG